MSDAEKPVREIRINRIVPSESVLVVTARSMRPKKAEAKVECDTRAHVETCPFSWDFEPDAPIFTPRISDCLVRGAAALSVVRRDPSEGR